MPKITYISAAGTATTVVGRVGASVMQCALDNDIAGIVAECGGACSCATCHVYVAQEWFDKLPAGDAMEKETLEFAAAPKPTSRLSCQLRLTEALDGLTVHTPETQY